MPINVQPSLSTLEVPVLVKSQEGLEILVRVAGTDALKAHGITEQSIFASALVKDLATKWVSPICFFPSVLISVAVYRSVFFGVFYKMLQVALCLSWILAEVTFSSTLHLRSGH